jgi:hypothetical protein
MHVDPTTRKVILGKKDCNCTRDSRLEPGTVIDRFGYKPCSKCKGTGKRGNGRCRECNQRDGYFSPQAPRNPGFVPDYGSYTTKVCPTCNGSWHNALDENLTDTLPTEYLADIPVSVRRRPDRPISFNEAHIGAGTVYSIVDYGEHRDKPDEWLIDKVRHAMLHEGFVSQQACKYTNRDTMKLCDEIVIVTSNQGFSAWPGWED